MYSKLTLTSLLFVVGIASHTNAEEALFATRVATGLSRPVYATFAPGQADQLYVVEQHSGRIKTLDLTTGVIDDGPFSKSSAAQHRWRARTVGLGVSSRV